MTLFEKYKKMQEELSGLDYNEYSMHQYLHIIQVMGAEEDAYRKHRKHMLEWLKNIEKSIYASAKRKADEE